MDITLNIQAKRVNQAISNLKTDTKTKLLDRTLSDVMKKRYKAMGDEYYAKQADKALESALAENYVIGNIGIDTIITELNIDSIFTNIIEPGIKNAQQQIGHEVSKAFMSQSSGLFRVRQRASV